MIFAFFHLVGLLFVLLYYKLKINLLSIVGVLGIFLVYYLTLRDASYLAMLIYSWATYFMASYILFKNVHVSYHVSIAVVIVGLFVSTVIERDAFGYYDYMFDFSVIHVMMMVLHLVIMIVLLEVRRRLTFYRESLYVSSFTFINMFIHFQIVMIHILRDFNIPRLYVAHSCDCYFRSLFYTSFVFYLVLIISAVFYQRKRLEEKFLFEELSNKQDDLRYLFETEPSKLIKELKELANEERYEELLSKTNNYMGEKKKVSHKRVLERLQDDLLAYVTMEAINKEEDIAFEVVVNSETKTSFSKKNYFLEMYGIVLDNALEAAKKADLRYVKIVFDKNCVIVENTFCKDDLVMLNEKVSLRGQNRRINGLKLLDYLEQESGIRIDVEVSYRVIVTLEVESDV